MNSSEHLYSLLEANLRSNPDSVVFVEDGQKISFSQFDQLCQQKERWLRSQGICKGDTVAMWLVNSRH